MKNKYYVPLVRLSMVKEKELPYTVSTINAPDKVTELAGQILDGADREYLLVISVDNKSHALAIEIVSIGTVNSTLAVPREIFKHAILNNAAGIILVHNHLSGDCEPSDEDRRLTKRVEEAGDILGITVFDHVIIGEEYYSFREKREIVA